MYAMYTSFTLPTRRLLRSVAAGRHLLLHTSLSTDLQVLASSLASRAVVRFCGLA
jgi:hypothetical protein